ncbi:MAG: alpha/beta hydrolase-fold protein [Saprospiraceae bacterium]
MEIIKYLTAILAVVLSTACTSEKANLAMENPAPAMSPESFLLYKNFPSKYTDPRDIEIWLPEKYGQLEALPVLYMFDGQNIFHGTKGWSGEYNPGWRVNKVLDSLNKAGAVPEIIVVGIFNGAEKRGAEYMPAKPKELVQRRIIETEHEWV